MRIKPELVSPIFLLVLGIGSVTFFSVYGEPRLDSIVPPGPSVDDFVAKLNAGPFTPERAQAAGKALQGMNEYAEGLAHCVRALTHLIKTLCFSMIAISVYDLWVHRWRLTQSKEKTRVS